MDLPVVELVGSFGRQLGGAGHCVGRVVGDGAGRGLGGGGAEDARMAFSTLWLGETLAGGGDAGRGDGVGRDDGGGDGRAGRVAPLRRELPRTFPRTSRLAGISGAAGALAVGPAKRQRASASERSIIWPTAVTFTERCV